MRLIMFICLSLFTVLILVLNHFNVNDPRQILRGKSSHNLTGKPRGKKKQKNSGCAESLFVSLITALTDPNPRQCTAACLRSASLIKTDHKHPCAIKTWIPLQSVFLPRLLCLRNDSSQQCSDLGGFLRACVNYLYLHIRGNLEKFFALGRSVKTALYVYLIFDL